jgi:hypothetical protein
VSSDLIPQYADEELSICLKVPEGGVTANGPKHVIVPASAIAHPVLLPIVTWEYEPPGGTGVVVPSPYFPQQASELSSAMAHAPRMPALTCRNDPGGASVWPKESEPQHAIVASVRTAHPN